MIKKIMVILCFLFFLPFIVGAEELNFDWQKSWGGDNSDILNEIFETSDGGFIVYGKSSSTDIEGLTNNGNDDAIIVKYDKDGNMLWQTSWGGNQDDSFLGIFQTSDDEFIACGWSKSTNIEGLPNKGGQDAIIVKFDKDGNMLWQKSLGGNKWESFFDIIQISDGGFILYGTSESTNVEGLQNKGGKDVIIVKYDKDFNMIWQKNWGGNNEDSFSKILQISDGEFISYGYSMSKDIDGLPNKGSRDAIIVKFDKDFNIIWQKSWGGNSLDYFSEIKQIPDGEFILLVDSYSTDIEGLINKGARDAVIVKYDKDGNMLWQNSFSGNGNDLFSEVFQILDGGFIVFGYSSSTDIEEFQNNGDYEAFIVKYDKDGNMLWKKSFGGNSYDQFDGVFQTLDEEFIAYGHSSSSDIEGLPNKGNYDGFIVKYNKDGNEMWRNSLNVNGNSNDQLFDAFQILDGEFILVGTSYSTDIEGLTNKGNRDVVIVKYSIEYNLEKIDVDNGMYDVEKNGKYVIIKPIPNEGYELDKIIIKDKNDEVLDLELTKLEDGSYSFDLYTDVSVEVLFKEKAVIENPKTGVVSYISLIFTMLFGFIGVFFVLKRYKKSYEL